MNLTMDRSEESSGNSPMEDRPAPHRVYNGFAILLMAEVVALALFQAPAERLIRYIGDFSLNTTIRAGVASRFALER